MSGRVGDLSPKQENALQQLKENIQDAVRPEWDDHYFLRWLRARNFDVKKSEKMFRENQEWRMRMGVDSILDWEAPEALKLYYPGGYFGEDKEGYPVWIDPMGQMDLKGMFFSVSKKDVLKYKIYWVEYLYAHLLPAQSAKHGRRVDQSTLVLDMAHVGMKHLWKPALDVSNEILAMFEANYPETLRTCYVINAPRIFPIIWNVAKPFLDEMTRKKIKVLGKNYKKELLEHISPDQLPVHWGGTCTDPDGDEYCRSKICMGGNIPEQYRLKNIRENIDSSTFENCTVQRGSTVQLEYIVSEAGSSIRWQFLSEGNDIGFGIFRRTADERQKKGDMEEVVKSERVNSHMVPEEGSVIVDQPGTYVARFDNTYSWVNAKKVAYLIDVLPPDMDNELQLHD